MAREYFKCFHSYREKTKNLTDAEIGRLFRALMQYSETGETPLLPGRESIAFDFIADEIRRDATAYDQLCKQNAQNRAQQMTTVNDRQRPSTTVNETPRKATEGDEIDKVEGIRTNKETLPIGSAKKAAPAFHPPTVEEVKAYCLERNNKVDAVRFVDYYTANGWKVGKNPMKDWRAAVRTWERDDRPSGIDRARKNNTLLNYKEEGRAYASLEEIKLDPSELDPDPPEKQARRKKRDMFSLGDGTTPHVNLDDIALTLEDEL